MGKRSSSRRNKAKDFGGIETVILEKGFDNTSLQDIIDQLGGLTKGVIYHHFDSKFGILQAIVSGNDLGSSHFVWHGDSGLERLQNSLKEAFSNLEGKNLLIQPR